MLSQALYYDRIRDTHPVDAATRLAQPFLVAKISPKNFKNILEWPVARVDSLLEELPSPLAIENFEENGERFERRWTRVCKPIDRSHKASSAFKVNKVELDVPLCVYEPSTIEDQIALAFNYHSFNAVPRKRVVDICHVASHVRFAWQSDYFLALDEHFHSHKLAMLGVQCLTPTQFVEKLDL